MVNLTEVRQSNSQIDTSCFPRTAVFPGGTAGLGKLTLEALAEVGLPFTAYVPGRKQSEKAFKEFAERLEEKNPHAKIIWIEAEIALLAETKRICRYILSQESTIDLLFMTPGYAPFHGREDTTEGIDTTHSLQLYTRLLFTLHLLPALRTSPTPRIITVHSGTMETRSSLNISDLNLTAPGAFGGASTQRHMCVMNSLALEHIACDPANRGLSFMHSHPGLVRTGNLFRSFAPGSWWMWAAEWIFDPLMWLVSFSDAEAKERYLFICTSGGLGRAGPVGGRVQRNTMGGEGKEGGMFLVSRYCDAKMNEREMGKLRTEAGDVVWRNVEQILKPYM